MDHELNACPKKCRTFRKIWIFDRQKVPRSDMKKNMIKEDKMSLIKILNVCSVKDITREIRSQITGREKILTAPFSEIGLAPYLKLH